MFQACQEQLCQGGDHYIGGRCVGNWRREAANQSSGTQRQSSFEPAFLEQQQQHQSINPPSRTEKTEPSGWRPPYGMGDLDP